MIESVALSARSSNDPNASLARARPSDDGGSDVRCSTGWPGTLLVLLAGLFAVTTCGGREETWNGDRDIALCGPDPRKCDDGLIGARCGVGDDCADGVCCLSDHCGGGMCTFLCGSQGDCPSGMACEGGFCFYSCTTDTNCGPGQKCEHDHTVCQY